MMQYRNPQWTGNGGINCEVEHPAHGWLPCTLRPDDPDTAELFAEVEAAGEVAAAPALVLAEVQAAKLAEINRAYGAALGDILRQYPEAERLTWDRQEREARDWQADNATPTPLLDGIAASRGLALSELVSRVIAKADAWIADSGAATGKRQRLEDAINAATDVATVEGITW